MTFENPNPNPNPNPNRNRNRNRIRAVDGTVGGVIAAHPHVSQPSVYKRLFPIWPLASSPPAPRYLPLSHPG